MQKDETFINEICTELQQLCTDLEKIQAIAEKQYSGGGIEDRERQNVAYSPGSMKGAQSPAQQENKFTRTDQGYLKLY